MPLNKIKSYNQLLDVGYLNAYQRKNSLLGIFKRDVEDNEQFHFRKKQIRPIKKNDGGSALETLFHHLTTKEDKDENGKKTGTRSYENARSIRLHWVKFHIDEIKKDGIDIFSYEDRIGGVDVIRTYIYDMDEDYVVILEPQKSKMDYYLLTAYHLNEPGGKKQIDKKQKKKLTEVH